MESELKIVKQIKKSLYLYIIIFVSVILIGLNIYGVYRYNFVSEKSLAKAVFFEFSKQSIQCVFIVFAGGILMQGYNRKKQRENELQELRKEMFSAIVEIYIKTKRVRWVLRSNHKNQLINYTVYKEQMHQLIEIKANIEVLRNEIETYGKHVEDISGNLNLILGNMEDYLRVQLKEYYAGHSLVTLNTKNLVNFNWFISKDDHDPNKPGMTHFTEHYRNHFYEALKLLGKRKSKLADQFSGQFFN